MAEIPATVLVVDDDLAVGKVLTALLPQAGLEAVHEPSGAAALQRLESAPVDLVLTDLRMPGMDGMELLRRVVQGWPDVPVIVLTAHGTISNAVEAMKAGAADFMLKPFDREEVSYTVQKALQSSRHLREKPPRQTGLPSAMIGECEAMRALGDLIQRAAQTSTTVMIRGESGTGKELVARAIHDQSGRRAGPFVPLHCAALPESLLESELFGHEKGAFTGATSRKPGRVELAEGGTLFLDEIGDLPLPMQVKLLRLLQEKEFQRIGGTRVQRADVRFVAATHRDLEAMVRAGEFREDFYYRISVFSIELPPLRERGEDIALLSRHLCRTLSAEHGRAPLELEDAAIDLLRAQDWLGNVRQLQNFIERLVILTDSPVITAETVEPELARLPDLSRPGPSAAEAGSADQGTTDLKSRRSDAERRALLEALERSRHNRSLAARILGISRRSLYNKLEEFGIE
jgi:two-component system response regulator AtoC